MEFYFIFLLFEEAFAGRTKIRDGHFPTPGLVEITVSEKKKFK